MDAHISNSLTFSSHWPSVNGQAERPSAVRLLGAALPILVVIALQYRGMKQQVWKCTVLALNPRCERIIDAKQQVLQVGGAGLASELPR